VLPGGSGDPEAGGGAGAVAVSPAGGLQGGIIAAGAGARLRQAGWTVPKPLVPVAGVPLIGHVLRNFAAVGIATPVVIVNEQARECADWLRSRRSGADLRIIVKTTASTLESFREVTARLGPGRALISTVDALCPSDVFRGFVDAALRFPVDATVLAVTPPADDEKPLWARLDASGRITALNEPSGDVVTAGIYLVPEHVRRLSPPDGVDSLRRFLRWLLDRGEPIYGVVVPDVVDVDRAEDLALAEALARRDRRGRGGRPGGTA
jgi:NDP-sugar pyrophosphorylase family protein